MSGMSGAMPGASTPASAIFGVAFGSLASGIGASPDGEAASWMNSCLLIGGVLDAPAIGPHRGYQLVIVLFDLRRDRRAAVSPPRWLGERAPALDGAVRRPDSGAGSPARRQVPWTCRSIPPCRARSDSGGRR